MKIWGPAREKSQLYHEYYNQADNTDQLIEQIAIEMTARGEDPNDGAQFARAVCQSKPIEQNLRNLASFALYDKYKDANLCNAAPEACMV